MTLAPEAKRRYQYWSLNHSRYIMMKMHFLMLPRCEHPHVSSQGKAYWLHQTAKMASGQSSLPADAKPDSQSIHQMTHGI